jgi:hypothetical protein
VHDVIPLSQGKHLRLRLTVVENGRNYSFNAVSFGTPFDSFPYREGDVCDVAFTVDMNEYMGIRTPQLYLKAVKPSHGEEEALTICNAHFELLASGKTYDGARNDVPDLSDFRNVFRYIRRECGRDGNEFSLTSVVRILENEFEISVSLCKLKIILEVLAEQKLISLTYRLGGNNVFVTILPSTGKINIDESPLLRTVRSGVSE